MRKLPDLLEDVERDRETRRAVFQRRSSAPVQDTAAMCGFSLLSRFRPQLRDD
jgi:hypothetical protein